MNLIISPNGDVSSFGDLPEWIEGKRQVRRVSHIVPLHPVKRVAFVALRWAFGERGRVASWTRAWYGPWVCTMVDSGRWKAHASRKVLIDWERSQLEGE